MKLNGTSDILGLLVATQAALLSPNRVPIYQVNEDVSEENNRLLGWLTAQ